MKGFKKCSNGHFYKEDLAQCPYCTGQGKTSGSNTVTMTGGGNAENTRVFSGIGSDDANKTVIMEGEKNSSKVPNHKVNMPTGNKTVFEDEIEEVDEISGSVVVKKERRTDRRLVGWLVTYSIDPLGIDYKIYEGRNMVGKHIDCDITVNDKRMSDKHALILFRTGEFVIQDQLSTHGTFVNTKDIKYDPITLNDGNNITMGDTKFKFKSCD